MQADRISCGLGIFIGFYACISLIIAKTSVVIQNSRRRSRIRMEPSVRVCSYASVVQRYRPKLLTIRSCDRTPLGHCLRESPTRCQPTWYNISFFSCSHTRWCRMRHNCTYRYSSSGGLCASTKKTVRVDTVLMTS